MNDPRNLPRPAAPSGTTAGVRRQWRAPRLEVAGVASATNLPLIDFFVAS